jgi:hypothetical protein
MAPLRNARHERFCRALAEGKTADEAYQEAGFQENRGNASRLKAKESVSNRLAELQSEMAKDTKVTVATICRELDEANAVAKAKGQAAAMVSASALRAKLAGLMVERVEVGAAGDFGACDTVEQVVDELLRYESPHMVVDEQDRRTLVEMYKAHFVEVEQYIAALRAKPIPPGITLKARRLEHRRHHGNGRV